MTENTKLIEYLKNNYTTTENKGDKLHTCDITEELKQNEKFKNITSSEVGKTLNKLGIGVYYCKLCIKGIRKGGFYNIVKKQ